MNIVPAQIEKHGPGVALSDHPDGLAIEMADPNPDLADARNAVTLSYDLSGLQQVRLAFEARESGDEPHAPPGGAFFGDQVAFDGVAISVDGVNWHEVQGLRQLRSDRWTNFDLDLDAAIAAAGLFHASQFRIRFCHVDNMPRLMDGIMLRGIRLSGEAWSAPDPDLLLHLPMDDNAPTPLVRDATRRHHQSFSDPGGDARTLAHSVEGPHGPDSRALSFDGVNDRIDLQPAETFAAFEQDHDFSIAFWWKEPPDRPEGTIFGAGDWAAAGAVRFYHDGPNRMHQALRRPDGTLEYDSIYNTNDDVWHHFALVRRNSTTIEWWVDGALKQTKTNAANDCALSGPFRLGYYWNYSFVRGVLADFRLYGRAIDEAKMAALASPAA